MDTDDSSLAFGLLAVTETCLSATCLLRHVYGIRTRHEWSALSYACRACFGGYLAVSAASCVGLAYGGRTASVLELAVCVIGSLLYYMLACLTMVFADEERLPARDYRCNQCFWSLVTCLVFLLHTVLIVDQLYAVPATSSTTLVLHTFPIDIPRTENLLLGVVFVDLYRQTRQKYTTNPCCQWFHHLCSKYCPERCLNALTKPTSHANLDNIPAKKSYA